MKTLTAYGKELRKIRIDNNNELLGEMAEKLEVSPALLSYIEVGSRSIRPGLTDKICKVYNLDEGYRQKLYSLEAEQSQDKVVINLGDLNKPDTEKADFAKTAYMFARDFSKMSTAQVIKVRELLESFEKAPEGEFYDKRGRN